MHDICSYLDSQIISCVCTIYVLYVSSYSEVKRVYDVCQYIFSGEGEYVLDMHYIFSQHDGGGNGSPPFNVGGWGHIRGSRSCRNHRV